MGVKNKTNKPKNDEFCFSSQYSFPQMYKFPKWPQEVFCKKRCS